MAKRQLVHHRTGIARTPAGVFTEIAKSWHVHFCSNRDCRQLYEDYQCEDVTRNGLCHECQGRERPLGCRVRDPQPCCWGNCEVVTDKEAIVRHRLAGPGPWFQCRTCVRSHGWPCTTEERKP